MIYLAAALRGWAMKRVRIESKRPRRWHDDPEAFPSLDPRDQDILRAKQLRGERTRVPGAVH